MLVQLCPFDIVFLNLSQGWLNDPEIKSMTNCSDFSEEQQRAWFESLERRKDYLIWGVTVDGKPIGVCGLKNISVSDCEYWGYIGDKAFWGRGIGNEILIQIEAKAMILKVSSIWLKVNDNNERAISLYKKHGFHIEQKTAGMLNMRKFL